MVLFRHTEANPVKRNSGLFRPELTDTESPGTSPGLFAFYDPCETEMKRKLCPRVNEPMTYIGVKIHDSIYVEIERVSRSGAQTRSEVIRGLLMEALRARGRVASAEEMAEASA